MADEKDLLDPRKIPDMTVNEITELIQKRWKKQILRRPVIKSDGFGHYWVDYE